MKKQLINYPCRLPLIGLAGPAGSGKKTVADLISKEYDVVQYGFLKPIKQMLQHGLRMNHHDTEGYRKEKVCPGYGKTPLSIMQSLHDWGCHALHPDIWIMSCSDYCESLRKENQRITIVMTDVVSDKQADWIRESGGVVIHINRPKNYPFDLDKKASWIRAGGCLIVRTKINSKTMPQGYVSEGGVKFLPDQDFAVVNHGDLLTLEKNTRTITEIIAGLERGLRHAS